MVTTLFYYHLLVIENSFINVKSRAHLFHAKTSELKRRKTDMNLGLDKTSSVLLITLLVLSGTAIFIPTHARALDTTSPIITILLPENQTWYRGKDVALNFTIDEPTSWIGYSLDGEANETITGNTTLTDLSYGLHNVTVYANDTAGNMGSSDTIHFTVTYLTDLTINGTVDMADLSPVAAAFGETPGRPRWNPDTDINGDDGVDIRDVVLVAIDFGKTWK